MGALRTRARVGTPGCVTPCQAEATPAAPPTSRTLGRTGARLEGPMAAVFIAQATLNDWSDQGKVRLDETVLTLLQENRTVKLKPAVRFTRVVDATPDPHGLLGKVKSKEQLVEL